MKNPIRNKTIPGSVVIPYEKVLWSEYKNTQPKMYLVIGTLGYKPNVPLSGLGYHLRWMNAMGSS